MVSKIFSSVVLLGMLSPLTADEPKFRDQPLSSWIAKLNDKRDDVKLQAVEVIFQMPPEMIRPAVPALIGALDSKNPQLKNYVCYALQKVGPDAAPAVPHLIKGIEAWKPGDEFRVDYLIMTLGTIGPKAKEAIPLLMKRIENPDEHRDHAAAISAIGSMGPDGKVAVPALLKLLRAEASTYAVVNIGRSLMSLTDGKQFDEVVRALVIREYVGKCVANPGICSAQSSPSAPVIERITSLLRDPEVIARIQATRSLEYYAVHARQKTRVSQTAKEGNEELQRLNVARDALISSLQDEDAKVRTHSACALLHLDETRLEPVVPVVVKLLADGKFDVHSRSFSFRQATPSEVLRPVVKQAMPALIAALDGRALERQEMLRSTIAELSDEGMPLVVTALESPDVERRLGAAAILRSYPWKASATAIPSLLKMAREEDRESQLIAFEALAFVDIKKAHLKEWLPLANKLLADDRPDRLCRMADALANLKRTAAPATPDLLAAMRRVEGEVRAQLAVTYFEVAPARVVDVLPELIQELKKPDSRWFNRIVRQFNNSGDDARAAANELVAIAAESKVPVKNRLKCVRIATRMEPSKIDACVPFIRNVMTAKETDRRDLESALEVLITWKENGQSLFDAIPSLELKDANGHRRNDELLFLSALAMMATNPEKAGPARDLLHATMTHKNELTPGYLFEVLSDLGPDAWIAAKELEPYMADKKLGRSLREIFEKLDADSIKQSKTSPKDE